MRRNTFKLMATVCAVAMGIVYAPSGAQAQSEDVPITLTTTSAITVTAGDAMDFGEWLLLHDGTNDIDLVMDPFADTVIGTPAGGASTAVEINPGLTIGSLLVQTPAAAPVNMFGAITDFTDAGLSYGSPTFSLNATAAAALSIAAGTPTVFTATGGADDTIEYGGTVTVSATPADSAHTANLNVTFSY